MYMRKGRTIANHERTRHTHSGPLRRFGDLNSFEVLEKNADPLIADASTRTAEATAAWSVAPEKHSVMGHHHVVFPFTTDAVAYRRGVSRRVVHLPKARPSRNCVCFCCRIDLARWRHRGVEGIADAMHDIAVLNVQRHVPGPRIERPFSEKRDGVVPDPTAHAKGIEDPAEEKKSSREQPHQVEKTRFTPIVNPVVQPVIITSVGSS